MECTLQEFLDSRFKQWSDDKNSLLVTKRNVGGFRVYTFGSHHTANYDTTVGLFRQIKPDRPGVADLRSA